MNTVQLTNVLKSDQAVGQILCGVFPCNKLPVIFSKPAVLVMNMDPSNMPGSHWVCMFFDVHDKCEYFDSYGLPPSEKTREYVLKYAQNLKCNKKCVQKPLTSTCGQLCVYFLVWRCRGVPMKLILQSLEKSYADEFVTGFVNGLFKIHTVAIDDNFIVNQIAQQWINFM